MKEKTSKKWDKRYKKGWHQDKTPTETLKKYSKKHKKDKSLEIACGSGQSSLYLAKIGYDVDAIDLSKKALEIAYQKTKEKNLDVNWLHMDFEQFDLPIQYYEIITASNFYLKGDFGRIHESLKKDGLFIYRHHLDIDMKGKEQIKSGPPKKFRFKQNKINKLLKGFEIKKYEEIIDIEKKSGAIFDLVAEKK